MDMIWLQRDLGLYVVGLFDTFHASKTLGYPKNSLAALLARHANFNAAKQYQMADWRMRFVISVQSSGIKSLIKQAVARRNVQLCSIGYPFSSLRL